MPAAHAKLSPSGSSRWLKCPGSVRMTAEIKSQSGSAAYHGTTVHQAGENILLGKNCETGISIIVNDNGVNKFEWLSKPQFEEAKNYADYVKRLVKRAKKRFDNSFLVKTKDDIDVRLKPILLVKDTVQKGIGTALRKITEEYYLNVAKELTFNELVNKVLLGETSKDLKSQLKQTYPVAIVEMRILQRAKLKK